MDTRMNDTKRSLSTESYTLRLHADFAHRFSAGRSKRGLGRSRAALVRAVILGTCLAGSTLLGANPAAAERIVGTRDVSPSQSLVTFNVSQENFRNEWMRLGVEQGAYELSRVRVHLTEGRFRDIQAPTLMLIQDVGLPIPLTQNQRPLRIEVFGRPLRQGTRLVLSEGREPPRAAPASRDSQSANVRAASQRSDAQGQQQGQGGWTAFAGHQTRLDDRDITIDLTDTGFRPTAIRLRSVGAPLHVFLLRVNYPAGQFRKLAMRAFVPQNGTTNPLPLPPEAGPVQSIRISFSVPQGVAAAPRIELEALGGSTASATTRQAPGGARSSATPTSANSVRVTDGGATFEVVADTF